MLGGVPMPEPVVGRAGICSPPGAKGRHSLHCRWACKTPRASLTIPLQNRGLWGAPGANPGTNQAGERTGQSLHLGRGLQAGTVSTKSNGAKNVCFVAVVCAVSRGCVSLLLLLHSCVIGAFASSTCSCDFSIYID